MRTINEGDEETRREKSRDKTSVIPSRVIQKIGEEEIKDRFTVCFGRKSNGTGFSRSSPFLDSRDREIDRKP